MAAEETNVDDRSRTIRLAQREAQKLRTIYKPESLYPADRAALKCADAIDQMVRLVEAGPELVPHMAARSFGYVPWQLMVWRGDRIVWSN